MQIISFTVSADKTNLELTINDAAAVSSLRLWNDQTYKNFSEVVDLTAKLTGASTENLTITLSDISEPYFDGVYFIEAKDADEASVAITSELARIKECIMDKVTSLASCSDCLKEQNKSLLNSHKLLLSLEHAIEIKFPSEIIIIKRALDKFCSNDCRSCGDFSNIVTSEAKDTLNPDTIIITLDGGSLD